ncbi:hypothetical protein BKA81DRAFT_431480 [Phyllosticta paracitricarpa]|uniref:Uncharacterized protein n=1 Tax=Phyllosticta paracitricarpa TaxID=2016321 RepID=A0ABR1NKZ2_9PEZI
MSIRRAACWPRDTWVPEIVSVALSLVAWAVNIALLAAFNGQPIFEWHSASLNTLVSVFSTLSRVLLLFAVSSALRQWNYITPLTAETPCHARNVPTLPVPQSHHVCIKISANTTHPEPPPNTNSNVNHGIIWLTIYIQESLHACLISSTKQVSAESSTRRDQ